MSPNTSSVLGFKSGDGRVRVFPHGVLARHIGREIALLDPPGEKDGAWLLRPLLKGEAIVGVPLSNAIEVSLQAVGRAAL